MQDAPIPRVDILACRNALMYFNAETQTRILRRLEFALNPAGVLFLGKAEMLMTHADMFSPIDLKLRIFGRAEGGAGSWRNREREANDRRALSPGSYPPSASVAAEDRARLYQAAFEASPVAQFVADAQGRIALVNARASHVLGLGRGDIGRRFHEMEPFSRPNGLRACIEKVLLDRRSQHIEGVESVLRGALPYAYASGASSEPVLLDAEATPLVSDIGLLLGVHVTLADVSRTLKLERELRRVRAEFLVAQEGTSGPPPSSSRR